MSTVWMSSELKEEQNLQLNFQGLLRWRGHSTILNTFLAPKDHFRVKHTPQCFSRVWAESSPPVTHRLRGRLDQNLQLGGAD